MEEAQLLSLEYTRTPEVTGKGKLKNIVHDTTQKSIEYDVRIIMI